MSKYTTLELFFSDWQWVRKLSKQYWVRDKTNGFKWVKFTNEELDLYKNEYEIDLEKVWPDKQTEDWRVK